MDRFYWGPGYAYTASVKYVDNITSWSEPRQGSSFRQTRAGHEMASNLGTDYLAQFDCRWIPISGSSSQVGWDYPLATGFRAFLEWGRQKNVIRYQPAGHTGYIECFLKEPMYGGPTNEVDNTKRITVTLISASGSFAL